MNTAHTLIAALTFAAASAAFGAEPSTATAATTATTATTAAAAATQQAPKPARQGLTRAEVQAQVIAARRDGTLIETEADMDVAQTRKHYAR